MDHGAVPPHVRSEMRFLELLPFWFVNRREDEFCVHPTYSILRSDGFPKLAEYLAS